MEELCLWLASSEDYVLLNQAPDPEYLAYLIELGFSPPKIITPAAYAPGLNATENVLACPHALGELRRLAGCGPAELSEDGAGLYLMPFGTSSHEERLSRETGIPLATPDAATVETVNSKIFSRELNEALGIRQVPGRCCRSLPELEQALAELRPELEAGRRLVIKDAFGVSGKGLAIVDTTRKLDQIVGMLKRQAQTKGTEVLSFVVEQWIEKSADLNHQSVIGRDGSVELSFVKEALTGQGVHLGHLIPPRLSAEQTGEIARAARALGRELHRAGYHGVMGVDGILGTDGTVYPDLEINARFNMSTYQCELQRKFLGEGMMALAKQYPAKLHEPVDFSTLRRRLEPLLLTPGKPRGAVITAFATLNAAASGKERPFSGRLYAMIFGDSLEELSGLDARLGASLLELETGGRDAHAHANAIRDSRSIG
jgi:hypothetical protein